MPEPAHVVQQEIADGARFSLQHQKYNVKYQLEELAGILIAIEAAEPIIIPKELVSR